MRCGIGLGSNVGDRLGHLREAYQQIKRLHSAAEAPLVSRIFETSPVDSSPGTREYLNAVVEIQYDRTPASLLDALLCIEREMGRPVKRRRNAPRTIDLDLLYAGNLILNGAEITVPHPRLSQRRFVLVPLAEIIPDMILPGQNKTIRILLEELTDNARAIPLGSALEG